MASSIDITKPEEGAATTKSVRDNFIAAKNEIEQSQNDLIAALEAITIINENVTDATEKADQALLDAANADAHAGVAEGKADAAIADLINKPNYASGNFTPVLSFAGSSVGVSYTSRFGLWVKIRDIVFYSGRVELSNKGSSVGSLQIQSFPIPSEDVANSNKLFQVLLSNTVGSLQANYVGIFDLNSTVMRVINMSANTVQSITNSDVANNLVVSFSGWIKA